MPYRPRAAVLTGGSSIPAPRLARSAGGSTGVEGRCRRTDVEIGGRAGPVAAGASDVAMPSWAAAILESQAAIVTGQAQILDAIRSLLAPQAGAIDSDAGVGQALAELQLQDFSTCEELVAMSNAAPAFRAALGAALIDDARQLGQCFGRLHKRGLIARGPKRGSDGWRWKVEPAPRVTR